MFDWAKVVYDKSVKYSKDQWDKLVKNFDESKAKLNSLVILQSQVDAKIAAMPAGAAKTALMAQREESRGFFSKYVMPAWEKISSYFGSHEKQMGVVPLIAIGGATMITAALGAFTAYTVTSYNKEMAILNDPRLSASQKTQLIQTSSITGGLSQATNNINKLLMGVGGLGLLYIGFKVAKKKNLI